MSTGLSVLATMSARPKAPRLTSAELAGHLSSLPGWEIRQERLCKTYRCASFHETMALTNAIAFIAHRQDHHPDLGVHFGSVEVCWSTHDAGGITLNDCICAARVEMLDR